MWNREDQLKPGYKPKVNKKVCVQCGREYIPDKPRQKKCNPCLNGNVRYVHKESER